MFSTSMLAQPRPSAGQSAPFSARPDGGPRRSSAAFAAALSNPTVRNRSGVVTNPTISYPFLSRPWSCGEDKAISEGSLLFLYRDDQHEGMNFKRRTSQLVTVANLPMLNAKFDEVFQKLGYAKRVSDLKHKEEEARLTGARIWKGFTSVEDFLKKWNFVGVMRNESNPKSKFQRLLNVDVRGRSRVRNIWSVEENGPVRAGDKLYLEVKEVQTPNAKVRTNEVGKPLKGALYDYSEAQLKMIQVTPVVNVKGSHRTANSNAAYIPIGTVSNAICKEKDASTRKRARRDGALLNTLDFIEIHVGIGAR